MKAKARKATSTHVPPSSTPTTTVDSAGTATRPDDTHVDQPRAPTTTEATHSANRTEAASTPKGKKSDAPGDPGNDGSKGAHKADDQPGNKHSEPPGQVKRNEPGSDEKGNSSRGGKP